MNKKEVQGNLIEDKNKSTEEEFLQILRVIAPGTHFRTGLDGALRAGKGGLIVVEKKGLFPFIDGGFKINEKFTPQKIIELSKMDGAIILSKDMKRILYANTMLIPSIKIKTNETGTRHRSAERVAKQIGTLSIAISERRNQITVFYKNKRKMLKETDEVLRKTNEHMQILERQKELFERHIAELNNLEIRNQDGLKTAIKIIQKGTFITRMGDEMKKDIIELGNEGILVKTRLKEVISDVDREVHLTIKEYTQLDLNRSKTMINELSFEALFEDDEVLKALNYETKKRTDPISGWRLLSKTSLEDFEIAIIVKEFGSLGRALYTKEKTIAEVLGEERAKIFKDETNRIKMNS